MKSNQLCMTRLSDRLLPIHPNNLNKVMHSEWESISQWLYDVLSSGDILCEISAVFTSIRRFITIFGMRLPKTQRIALVRLVIAYICCPNIDTKVIFSALQLLKCLMTKPYSLPSSSLSVDWKIFWDMERWIESELEASDGCIVWPEEERKAFCDCLALCTKFFPKSSIEEIWLRIRHNICSYLANESTCLSLYPFFTYTPFYPKHFDEISRVWLPDIFDLWYIHSDSGEHPEFIEILCKVSQIGRGRIDWEPHIERIFSGFLRRITLKCTKFYTSRPMDPNEVHFYAQLIMNTIGPDRPDCQSSVIYRLEQSFKAMESFYHPSSEQKESAKLLTCFISKFLRCLISRLRDELFPPVEALDLGYAPPEFYLSVEQIDQIVNLFTPICLKYLLYSKVDLIVNTAVKIISMLSKLRPSIVIPYLLNDLEYGLIKPEMPLRFTRPLYALSLSVQSLIYVRFPLYPRGCFSAYHFDEEDSDRYDDDDDDIVVEDDMTIDTTNVKDDSENESVEEEEDLLSSDADDEFSGKLKHIKLQDDNKLNDKSRISSLHHSKHGVKKKIFRKSSYTPAYTHVSPSVRNGHLKAFTYLAGRAELNRVLQILLHGLDMNDLDRLNYTIACLSRIFLSTPILTFSIDDNNNEYINPITKKIINESIEVQDTIFIIYERILSFLTKLNETTNLDIQNNINISFSTTYRPYAKPIDNSRSPLDICQMSELTGLCIAIAISISSNLHLKYRLIKHLTNIIFTYQWALDISRLLGYQAYWFAVDSLSTNITNNSSINLLQCKDNLPSSIYSIKLIWPKFISIIKEIENDGSFIHHDRPEPRLLSLLYILPGYICALPAESLVDPTIYEQYIQPLIIILGKLLYLSTGYYVKPQWNEIFTNIHIDFNINPSNNPPNSCPTLAEASASFLGMLLHRLTSYSIDLRCFNLLGNIVGKYNEDDNNHQTVTNAYAESSWWTPFVNLKSIVNFCHKRINRNYKHQHSFWFIPTLMTKSLAQQLIKAFLYPIMQQLENTHDHLKCLLQNKNNTHIGDNNMNRKSYVEQRNQLTSLTIWMNHVTNGLSDALAPRKHTVNKNTTQIGNEFMPWHGLTSLCDLNNVYKVMISEDLKTSVSDWDITYFYMSSENEISEELRESIFKLGLKLLDVISKLIEQTDDNLLDENIDNIMVNSVDDIQQNDTMAKSNHYGDSTPKSIWLVLNHVQIVNLLELTHRAAFNLPMLERRPCLLQIVYGPYGLLASNLGASNCLHSLNRKYNNENCYSSKLIPSLNSLTGMYSPTTLSKYECGEELKTYFGCTLITYTARIQERLHTLFMSHKRKQLMLTTKNSNDQLISRSIASCYIIQPSLPIIKLTEILCSLAISPHRSDIQQFAIWLLNSYIIKFIPSIGTQVVKSMIHRLDNIIPDIKTSISLSNSTLLCSSSSSAVSSSSSSSTSSLSAATSTSSIISLDAKLKVIHRRRISIIMLLKSIYCRDLWNREYDELFRLDPNIFVQFCISLIQQLINFDKEKSIWLNNSLNNHHNDSLNHQQRQLKQLKMNRDYLENLINQILLSLKQFPVNCILYFPVNYKVDKIPSNSWVCKLYNEVDYCLNVFQYPCNIETLNTSNKFISKVFEKRREAVILFTQNISEYIVDICSNLCKNISSKEELLVDNTTHNNNSSSSSSSISWMFISTLLRFLRFPINRSLIPEWNRQSNRLIPPFIYPPSLKFIQITLELIVYQQTDVAFSACKCISRLIYHLLSYYRVPSRKCIYPMDVCKKKLTEINQLEHYPINNNNNNFSIIPGPRPDNLWLLYNENAKVLQSNEAYQSHHHIGSMPYGYVYYPIELYIYDPDCIMPYPVFNENKQLVLMSSNKVSSIIIDSDLKTNSIDYYQLWLSHFTANDEQNDLRQQCACLLATKLSSPLKETREFWVSLAKNLLYIHRAYLDQPNFSFPIRFLIHVSLIAFGPENMLEHIENFIKTLLITLPNSNLPLDGKAEFIGFFWVCATLDVLINASFLWQRQWKYYFWGRMIPRILCWSEICALKVSLNDLACSIDERLHPTLKLIKWARTQYAGRFAGGRDDIDHIIIGNPEAINGNSSLPKNESSSSTMNTIHLSSSSTAGGPLHRVIFMYEYCISRVMLNVNHDVHCLHPLWDWAVQGLLDCYSNVQNNNNNSQLKISSCQHVVNKNHGITTIIEDNCPLCLLVEQLPIHHRRVFCERICHLFILSLDWIGISLYKGLISSIQNKISLTLSSYQSDIWLYQACDNSIWIRDIAAEMAAFRITCLFNIMKYKTKNCLNTIMYKSEKIEFTCLTKQLSFIDYEIVIKNLLQINDNEKLVGGDFLFNLFIPLLVRDTLNILRLKGQNISKSCTHLPEAPPEHINSSILKQIYNAISNNKELIKEDDRNSIDKKINCRSEMIVLSNRLFSLYTCLTFSLAKQYPIYSKERQDNNIVENCMHQLNLTCYTNICQWLMPLIADVCSINNAYDYLILSLNMNIFQDNSSLSIKDYLNKELDGLYFGLSSYLLDFSTLALSGQQQYNIENVLYSIEQFIQYFLKHESWRTRVIGLLLFRNLIIFNLSAFHTIHYNNNNTNNNNDKYENSSSSSLNNITIEQIINKRLINILWDCLNDPFLEVCHTAMFVMAVFIEINLIKYDAKWIDDLVKQMNRPLPKSINQSLSNTIQTGNRLTNDHDYQSPIRSRYTAILALCSFIHGHPHTTPDYLPFIISELTNHIHDPQPIKKVITSTISAYSRSHQDVWHEQSLKFTPEQLDNYKFVISNVSYYV